jgi:hypothetical protein
MQNEEEDLIRRLNRLTLEKTKIENRLLEIQQQRTHEDEDVILDRYGKPINVGDTVIFLTKGKFNSSRGTVTKTNEHRVTAKDKRGISISRAPHNVRKI